jgi:RsiW-degrading membrane proteinase PrsW (M82 family)
MTSIFRLVGVIVILLMVVAVFIMVSDRIGSDPLNWLVIIISVAAVLAFWLQVLKNW